LTAHCPDKMDKHDRPWAALKSWIAVDRGGAATGSARRSPNRW